MLKTLRENPATHVADMVAVTDLNVVVSVLDSTRVVCIPCRRLVVSVRLMAIAMSDLEIRLRPGTIVLGAHEPVIAPSHLGKILVEKPSVVDVRILVVRMLRLRIRTCDDRRHDLSSQIALHRVVGRRMQADRSRQIVRLRDVRVRVDHLLGEHRLLVGRLSMIREVMP
jgi:hypothetical protein